jgi:hypothetical protein
MNQYQIHHLENKEDWTCVTLQCYEFAKPDNVHDEHFRYFEENGTEKKSFAPRSDCTFADFYTYMDWEWKNKKAYGT